ncbi:helix-turn-helix domain-containing protein [Chryseobacterium sp. M5A1_1a]
MKKKSSVVVACPKVVTENIKISKNKKRYNEVLKKLEENKMSSTVIKKNNKIPIKVDIEKEILDNLKKFESSKEFLNKDLTLSLLSTQLKTNNTYLSEIINRHYNKNFTTYINELKIYYIIDKINTQDKYKRFKISHLAEESGFASHSSFTITFKNVTGITPTEFINLSKKQNSDNINA